VPEYTEKQDVLFKKRKKGTRNKSQLNSCSDQQKNHTAFRYLAHKNSSLRLQNKALKLRCERNKGVLEITSGPVCVRVCEWLQYTNISWYHQFNASVIFRDRHLYWQATL